MWYPVATERMGPAARTAGPLLLQVKPTESGQIHNETRRRVEVFDSIPSAGRTCWFRLHELTNGQAALTTDLD